MIKRTSAELDAAVFAEQMSLVSRGRFDLILNVVVATLLAGMLWRLFPPWMPASWVAAVWIVAGIRATLRHRLTLGPPSLERYRLGWRFYLAGTLVTGAPWGVTGTVVLETSDPLHYILVVFVLAGVMADEIVPTAKPVLQPGSERDDHDRRDRLGGHDPGPFVLARAEIALNVGQGDVSNRGVEGLHERRSHDGRDDERAPQARLRNVLTLNHRVFQAIEFSAAGLKR